MSKLLLAAAVAAGALALPAAASAATTTSFGGTTQQRTDGQTGAAAVTYNQRTRAITVSLTMVAPCTGLTDGTRFTALRQMSGKVNRDGSFALVRMLNDANGDTGRSAVTGRLRGSRVSGTFEYEVNTADGLACKSGTVRWSASSKHFAGTSIEAPFVLDTTKGDALTFRVGRFQLLCDGGQTTNMRPVNLTGITPSSSRAAKGSGTVQLTLDGSGITLSFQWTASVRISRAGVATVTYAFTNGTNSTGTRTGCYAGPLTVKLS